MSSTRVLASKTSLREIPSSSTIRTRRSSSFPHRCPCDFDDLDPEVGVFAANLETALNIVHDTPVRLGETALIFGQGVVGFLVALLLKLAGAGPILVVDPLEERRSLALATGADGVFAPEGLMSVSWNSRAGGGLTLRSRPAGPGLPAERDRRRGDRGDGRRGFVVRRQPVTLALGGHFHRGRVRLCSSQVGRSNPTLAPRWDRARRMETVLGLLGRLKLKELISHRIPFEEAPEAYTLLEEARRGACR